MTPPVETLVPAEASADVPPDVEPVSVETEPDALPEAEESPDVVPELVDDPESVLVDPPDVVPDPVDVSPDGWVVVCGDSGCVGCWNS